MLEALYEKGVVPDFLVATSIGALNAAFVSSRPQRPPTARALGAIWRNLQREELFPVSLSALIGGICGRRDHLVPERALRHLIARCVEFEYLTDAAIPLHLVTYDLIDGSDRLLSNDGAVDAIAAAAAIPGIFPPVAIAGRQLIDGALANSTPISHAVELGAERIYVLPARNPGAIPRCPPDSAIDTTIYGVNLLADGRLKADIARYSRDVQLIVLQAPNTCGIQPTSFEQSEHLIAEALRATRAVLVRQRSAGQLRVIT
jgi:NTE family protein